MGSISVNTLSSLYAHNTTLQFSNPRPFLNPNSPKLPLKSPFLNLLLPRKPLPFHLLTHIQKPPHSSTSSSPLLTFSNLSTPTLPIQLNLSKIVITLLAGSFLFLACCLHITPPAMAVTAGTSSSSSAVMEEVEEEKEREEMSEKVLEGEPKNIEALKVVVYGKLRRGKTKQAVEYVERLIDLEPDEVEWKLLLALSHELMGHFSKAKRLFREILEENPLLVRALHGLALVMHKNNEGPAVFEMLDKALDIARCKKRVTEERNIRILIAQMLVIKGDLEEGLKKFQDLVTENPRDFRPYLCQGIIYSLMDKKEEAAEQFETYRALVPEEFPQRGFLDDVVLEARTKSQQRFQKEFDAQFSYGKYKKSKF